MLYLYFNINEYFTAGYKLQGMERTLLDRLFVGDYAVIFWTAQSVCVFIPLLIMLAVLGLKRYEHFIIPGMVFASGLVIVGAWAKRYIIIVPTLRSPFLPSGQRLPWEWTHYSPTWVEWSITAAAGSSRSDSSMAASRSSGSARTAANWSGRRSASSSALAIMPSVVSIPPNSSTAALETISSGKHGAMTGRWPLGVG